MAIGDVTGRSILIIGGTRGIGRAIAERLAQLGARVGLTGRSADNAREAASAIAPYANESVTGYALDASDRCQIRRTISTFTSDHAGMDALIYNAGISPVFSSAEKISEDAWDSILAVNLTGAFIASQCYARHVIESGGSGAVVVMGSILGLGGGSRLAAYSASKAGLTGLVKSLALDWARYNIRVNMVAPGWVATDFTMGLHQNPALHQRLTDRTPLRRFATPGEISDLAVFLCSDSARFITGSVYTVDGGWTAE